MASHLNPPNRQSHVCNFSQLIRDIRHASLTRLLDTKVEIYQLPTLPTSLLQTSSPTSGEPLAPSGSFILHTTTSMLSKFPVHAWKGSVGFEQRTVYIDHFIQGLNSI